jgi:hypothetical protein
VYRLQRAIPMGRIGKPVEVARAVAFFLDETVTYVTGQTIFVCGGLSLGTFGAQSPAMSGQSERVAAPPPTAHE